MFSISNDQSSAITWQFQWRIYENQIPADTTQFDFSGIYPGKFDVL